VSGLEVKGASVRYVRDGAYFNALQDVSLSVPQGQTVALIGESGSGKSTLARAVVGLVPLRSGEVLFEGIPLPRRGRRPVGMVFQDPLGSLDPLMTVTAALREVLTVQKLRAAEEQADRVAELLSWVGLPPEAADLRPAQLSGGQQQRVAIARALASEPRALVLDEPVSALDVSVRAQILRLLHELRQRLDIALLFIGHDLAVVRQLADRIAVLYRGHLVEEAPAAEFFARPLHPYSQALLASVPSLRRPLSPPALRAGAETTAEGIGCVYASRCPHAEGASFEAQPELVLAAPGHRVACHHWERLALLAEDRRVDLFSTEGDT
jgi:oligopeptide/dipeptide ABC transporter ATP-binding protein